MAHGGPGLLVGGHLNVGALQNVSAHVAGLHHANLRHVHSLGEGEHELLAGLLVLLEPALGVQVAVQHLVIAVALIVAVGGGDGGSVAVGQHESGLGGVHRLQSGGHSLGVIALGVQNLFRSVDSGLVLGVAGLIADVGEGELGLHIQSEVAQQNGLGLGLGEGGQSLVHGQLLAVLLVIHGLGSVQSGLVLGEGGGDVVGGVELCLQLGAQVGLVGEQGVGEGVHVAFLGVGAGDIAFAHQLVAVDVVGGEGVVVADGAVLHHVLLEHLAGVADVAQGDGAQALSALELTGVGEGGALLKASHVAQHLIVLLELLEVDGGIALHVPGLGGQSTQLVGDVLGDHVLIHQGGVIAPDGHGSTLDGGVVVGNGVGLELAGGPVLEDVLVLVQDVEGVLLPAVGGLIVAQHIVEEAGVDVVDGVVALVDEGLEVGDVPVPTHLGPEVYTDVVVHDNALSALPGVLAVVQAVVPHTGGEALGVDMLGQLVDVVGQHVLPLVLRAQGLLGVVVEHALVLGGEGGAVKLHVLVAADVEVGAALKQLHVLIVQRVDVLHSLRVGHVQTGLVVRALVADLAILGVGLEDLVHMAGAVKGGDDLHAVLLSLSQNLPHLVLGQVLVRDDGGVGLTLNAEAQVLREVDLDGVHLQEGHLTDLADEPVLADVLTGTVHMETALGHVGIVHDGAVGQTVVGHHVVLDGAQGVHDGVLAGGGDDHAVGADVNAVGLGALGAVIQGAVGVQLDEHISGSHVLLVGVHHGEGGGGDHFLLHKLGVDQLHHFGQALVLHVLLGGQHSQAGGGRHHPGLLGIVHGVLLDNGVDQGGQVLTAAHVHGDRGVVRGSSLGQGKGGGQAEGQGGGQCQGGHPFVLCFHCFKSFPMSGSCTAPPRWAERYRRGRAYTLCFFLVTARARAAVLTRARATQI